MRICVARRIEQSDNISYSAAIKKSVRSVSAVFKKIWFQSFFARRSYLNWEDIDERPQRIDFHFPTWTPPCGATKQGSTRIEKPHGFISVVF